MSRPELAELLERAAKRLEQPGAWTQGVLARAFGGSIISARDASAESWCLLGALEAEAPSIDGDDDPVMAAEETLAELLEGELIAGEDASYVSYTVLEDWNDAPGRTQAEVVDLLRRAAATMRGEP